MFWQIRLYRFHKLVNIGVLICHGLLLIFEELFLDKITAWLRVEASWVDSIVAIAIIVSVIGFVLWVIIHQDKESTAKQIYLTIQSMKAREKEIIQDVLPIIYADNKQIAINRNYLSEFKSELSSYSDDDIENMEGHQIGNLITGNTILKDEKKSDKKLKSLNKRLEILRGEVLSSELENILNEYLRIKQGVENVTVGFDILGKCFVLDIDFIGKMTKIIRRGNIKVQNLERRVVEILSDYAGKTITQCREAKAYAKCNNL